MDRTWRQEAGPEPSDDLASTVVGDLGVHRRRPLQAHERDVAARLQANLFPSLDQPMQKALGRYELVKRLGSGGAGIVYEAYDPKLDRRVAVKVLHDETNPQAQARLVREAQVLASLGHPNIVQIFDVGFAEQPGQQSLYLVMELVAGPDLSKWLRAEGSWRRILEVYLQAGRGLAAAHAAGVLHRDFKPSNILLDPHGLPKVADFGLARAMAVVASQPTDRSSQNTPLGAGLDEELTHPGSLLGTPGYMSPEQLDGCPTDERSDQYAFCVSLWQGLTGQRLFEATNIRQLRFRQRELPALPRQADPPIKVFAALRRGLEPDPANRWVTMEELLGELTRATRPRRYWLAAGFLGLAAIHGVLVTYGGDDANPTCQQTAQPLSSNWTQRKAELGETIPLTARAGIDEFVATWTDAATQTCDDQADDRHDCLVMHRREAEALFEVLLAHDVDQARIDASVRALPDPTSCLTGERPLRLGDEVGRAIAVAGALQRAGRYHAAMQRLDVASRTLAPAATALEQAALDLARGSLLRRFGRYDDSEAALQAAFFRASELDTAAVAARAALELFHLRRSADGHYGKAGQWLDHAKVLVPRSKDPELAPELLEARGHSLIGKGDPKGLELLREAADAFAAQGRAEQQADALGVLGEALLGFGNYEDAEEVLGQALREWDRLGTDRIHPGSATTYRALARLVALRDDSDKGFEYLRRVIEAWSVYDERHPQIAWAHTNLGNMYFSDRQYERSKEAYEEATRRLTDIYGEDHPKVALVQENLGSAATSLGQYHEAIEHLQSARATFERVHGSDDRTVGQVMAHLGIAFDGLGEHDRSIDAFREAVRILEHSAAGPLVQARVRQLYAEALHHAGRDEQARAQAQQALAMYRQAGSRGKLGIDEVERWLQTFGGDGTSEPPR